MYAMTAIIVASKPNTTATVAHIMDCGLVKHAGICLVLDCIKNKHMLVKTCTLLLQVHNMCTYTQNPSSNEYKDGILHGRLVCYIYSLNVAIF